MTHFSIRIVVSNALTFTIISVTLFATLAICGSHAFSSDRDAATKDAIVESPVANVIRTEWMEQTTYHNHAVKLNQDKIDTLLLFAALDSIIIEYCVSSSLGLALGDAIPT